MDFEFNLYNVLVFTSIFSTILYILKTLLFLFAGGDVEIDADFDSVTETDTSFNFLSVQSILAFFMGFGWSGLTCLVQLHTSGKIAVIAAFIVGLIFMFLSAYLMLCVRKLNKTIKVDYNELTGSTGKAYNSFSPNGKGQIEIILNKQLTILEATNISNENIEAFSQIKVVKVEDNNIYITKG